MGRREMRFLGLAALFSLPAHLGAASIAVAVNLRVAPIMLRLGRNHRVRLAAVGFLAPLPLMPFAYAPYLARIPDTVTVLVLRSVVGNFLSLVASALVTGVFAVAFQRVTAHSNKGTYDVFD
jgi:hypothetical protein